MIRFVLITAVVIGPACADDEGSFPGRADGPPPVLRPTSCRTPDFPAVAWTESAVISGTPRESTLALTAGQRRAIVAIWTPDLSTLVCSGTVVSPTAVVTAEHCLTNLELRVRFGEDAREPYAERGVASIAVEPDGADLAILQLSQPAPADVTPIPIDDGSVTTAVVGSRTDMAGYGTREDGDLERRFVASPITSVTFEEIAVDGGGQRGLCFGDSGGPLLWLADDGVRVAGVLSSGDASCVADDRYTRLATRSRFIRDEIDDLETVALPVCRDGGLSVEGDCEDRQHLLTCSSLGLERRRCASDEVCGWSSVTGSHACLPAEEAACPGIPASGRCDGDTVRWCDEGTVRSRDCAACGERCVEDPDDGTSGCTAELCSGVSESGRCAQDVVEYCDPEGRFRQLDCRSIGQVCTVTSGVAGCVIPPGICDRIGSEGACVDDRVAVFCRGRDFSWVNCANFGQRCDYLGSDIGFFCTP